MVARTPSVSRNIHCFRESPLFALSKLRWLRARRPNSFLHYDIIVAFLHFIRNHTKRRNRFIKIAIGVISAFHSHLNITMPCKMAKISRKYETNNSIRTPVYGHVTSLFPEITPEFSTRYPPNLALPPHISINNFVILNKIYMKSFSKSHFDNLKRFLRK